MKMPENIRSFLAYAIERDWKSGEIIQIWNPDTGIFYVIKGKVHIIRLLKDGSRSILHIIHKNNFFFENRFFNPDLRTTVAYAASPTRTAYLKPECVNQLLSQSFDFCHFLILNMAKKNLSCGKNIVDNYHMDPETRMLNVLFGLACEDGAQPSPILKITQASLSEFVGKHPVNTNIILKRLEKKGFLTLKRGIILLELTKIAAALRQHENVL